MERMVTAADPGTAVLLREEPSEGVALLTLHRPEARNALSVALRERLRVEWEALAGDDSVRVVVLTGSGPAFCAGLDLREITTDGGVLAGERRTLHAEPLIPPLTVPVIGAVNGPAVTGGWELALACTFLVASERAWFSDTHARLGLLPGAGLAVSLSRRVGHRLGVELSLTGRRLDAAEAARLGLVNRVVPHERLLPTALEMASDIARLDPVLVPRLLELYRQLAEAGGHAAWAVEHAESRRWLAERGPVVRRP